MTALVARRPLQSGKLTAILLFLPPALLLFSIFVVLPIIEAAWYSGFNWNGFGSPKNWIGFDNFYVITRYNRSSFYAMSVFQLAEALRAAQGKTGE